MVREVTVGYTIRGAYKSVSLQNMHLFVRVAALRQRYLSVKIVTFFGIVNGKLICRMCPRAVLVYSHLTIESLVELRNTLRTDLERRLRCFLFCYKAREHRTNTMRYVRCMVA